MHFLTTLMMLVDFDAYKSIFSFAKIYNILQVQNESISLQVSHLALIFTSRRNSGRFIFLLSVISACKSFWITLCIIPLIFYCLGVVRKNNHLSTWLSQFVTAFIYYKTWFYSNIAGNVDKVSPCVNMYI